MGESERIETFIIIFDINTLQKDTSLSEFGSSLNRNMDIL